MIRRTLLLIMGLVSLACAQRKPAERYKLKHAVEVQSYAHWKAVRIGKEWGVHSGVTHSWVIPPRYACVLLTPYGFLAAVNDSIYFFTYRAKLVLPPVYGRLGFFWNAPLHENTECIIDTNGTRLAARVIFNETTGDSTLSIQGVYPWNGNCLHNLHTRQLEWVQGQLVVNDYDADIQTDGSYHLRPHSGLYNPVNSSWVISPGCSYLVSGGNKHIALMSKPHPANQLAFYYRVYRNNKVIKEIYPDPQSLAVDTSQVKWLIPYDSVIRAEHLTGNFIQGGYYRFVSRGKTGIFDPGYLQVIADPVYDAVISGKAALPLFVVQNNRLGLTDVYESGSHTPCRYSDIYFGQMRDSLNSGTGMCFDGEWFVTEGPNVLTPVAEKVWPDERFPYMRVSIRQHFILVEDVTPPFKSEFPIQVFHGSETTDSLDGMGHLVFPTGNAAVYASGILNSATGDWLVPARYQRVGLAGAYYLYGSLPIGNLNQFTLYSQSGQKVMDVLNAYVDIRSPVLWGAVTGYEGAVRSGRVECDTAIRTHRLHDAVYVRVQDLQGVFNLNGMQWIIPPAEGEWKYLPGQRVFLQRVLRNGIFWLALYTDDGIPIAKLQSSGITKQEEAMVEKKVCAWVEKKLKP